MNVKVLQALDIYNFELNKRLTFTFPNISGKKSRGVGANVLYCNIEVLLMLK